MHRFFKLLNVGVGMAEELICCNARRLCPGGGEALELIAVAEQMIQAGASSLLIEGAAAEVAEIITKGSEVPVIGCGSGPGCDGQILIVHDILGLTQGASPKFAKSYGNLGKATIDAFTNYAKQVQAGQYPDKEHSYHMKAGEFERLQGRLKSSF